LRADDAIEGILGRTGVKEGVYDEAMAGIRNHGQVVLNFHPDRLGVKRQSVVEALLREGCYRNQFETGLSILAGTQGSPLR
jgi:hypothetical protein